MKRLLFTMAVLCGLATGLKAQNNDTTRVFSIHIDTVINGQHIEVISDATYSGDSNMLKRDGLFGSTYRNDKVVQSIEELFNELGYDLDSSGRASIDSLAAIFGDALSALSDNSTTNKSMQDRYKAFRKKVGYGFAARSDFDFLWAFTNWGDAPYSGLTGTHGASALNTTFTSYQLEWNYAFVMVPHWQVKLGLGYESDVYKFQNPDIVLTPSGFCGYGSIVPLTNCLYTPTPQPVSTKLVTRYVTMPFTITYRSRDYGRRFTCSVAAIPGLTLSGKHSGMKYTVNNNTGDGTIVQSVSQWMNPVKCDLRFEIGMRKVSMFVQVPLMPVFDETIAEQYYPIKLGFKL